MVVEDEPAILEQIAAPLRRAGHEVTTARDGADAFRALGLTGGAEPKLPDVILADVMLPLVNGYMVCARLAQDPKMRQIPIVMVSGYTDFKEPFRKFRNIAGWIDKPFQLADILNKVADIILEKRADAAAN